MSVSTFRRPVGAILLVACVLTSLPAADAEEGAAPTGGVPEASASGDDSAGAALPEATLMDDKPADGQAPSLYEQFHRGGTWMWPILFCSFVCVAFALERLVNLRRSKIIPPALVATLNGDIDARPPEDVSRECKEHPSCLARVILAGLERAGFSLAEMERVADEQSQRELYELRKNSRPLGIVATVSPMLGLLGTVSGMISAFDVVARHGALGDPKMLSGSIATALLTTGFGLLVAIPALILHHYFRGKADNLMVDISDISDHVFVRFEGRTEAKTQEGGEEDEEGEG